MRRTVLLGLVAVASAACVEDDKPPIPEGEYYQYAIGSIAMPMNNNEAREYGLDLNGDATVDNQLGMIFATLEGQGFSVADTVRESLLRGNAIMLAELQTTAFDEASAAGLRTDLGANPVPSACTDPADLMTCGMHLETRAHYDVLPQTASNLGVGPFDAGRLIAPLGTLPIAIGIDPAAPLRVDLRAAKIRVTEASPAGAKLVIAGGILESDVDEVVIPEVTRNLARIVHDECGVPNTGTTCGCPSGKRAALIQRYFDDNGDCSIEAVEVSDNSIIRSLFSTDLRIDGREMLSFGIGATLVPATFDR